MRKILNWWVGRGLPLVHVRLKSGFDKIILDLLAYPILRRVAKYYLVFLKKTFGIQVIGITGSAGKTTVKEMVASILKLEGSSVWTKENIDPVFNIPKTILKCRPKTKYLILEMGVEYKGEMDFYLWLAKPDIAVVTNIYPTHTLYFGDVAGVYMEKAKIMKYMNKNNYLVLNNRNRYTKLIGKKTKAKTIWFEGDGDTDRQNETAAATTASILGIAEEKIKKGILAYKRPDHRLKKIKHRSGTIILDDSYNSNPEAFLLTLKKFDEISSGREKVGVIGDMLELGGKLEESEHRRVGRIIAKSKFKVIIGIGRPVGFLLSEVKKISPLTSTYLFNEYSPAIDLVKSLLNRRTAVLVKGSRSIQLDKLVEVL